MSNKRLNLTLEDGIWMKVDKFRADKFQSRQEFVKTAVVEYIAKLQRYEDIERDDTTRMLRVENERLNDQLNRFINGSSQVRN